MKTEGIRGKILAVTIVMCSLSIGTFSFTLDAVADEATMYDLTVTVVSGHGTVEPDSGSYYAGTVVTLTATPEAGYYVVRQWTGTDDDTSCALTNTVTMDSDKTVTVEFGPRRHFLVPFEYTTIQEAIDAAACGDIVIVSAGVHYGNIDFNGKNIRVTSMNPDDPNLVAYTIIQGTGTGSVVTFSGSESQSCVLDGLTITGGNTTGDGGGICGNGTEATIANCVITNNHADGAGGGVSNCNGTIERCTITGNTAGSGGGGIYVVDCNVSVEDCDINYNAAAEGGGLYCIDSPGATITRCTISDNDANGSGMARGGGIFSWTGPTLIEDCEISYNSASTSGGGIYLAYGEQYLTIVRNCLIVQNSAVRDGAGISSNWQNVSIISNCTIADNAVADGYGGGLYCSYESDVEVINSIIWGNFAEQGFQVAVRSGDLPYPLPSMLALSHSDVEGGPGGAYVGVGSTLDWGIGAIDSDPQLVDPNGGDWHLGVGSPCIDAGDNTAVPPSVLTDLDGNPRIVNDTVDMGAYEFQGIQILYVDADATAGGDGESWDTAFRHLQDALFNAVPPAEIRVSQGIYKPDQGEGVTPGDREATFQLKSGVTLKGGYAGFGEPYPNTRDIELYETILTGDLHANDALIHNASEMFSEPTREDNSYHVITAIGVDRTAILDGFTITGGHSFGWPDNKNGAAMLIEDCSPTITNCIFQLNCANRDGGGVYVDHGNPRFIYCEFRSNAAYRYGGGVGLDDNSTPVLENCKFSENAATDGGGLNSDNSTPSLTGCTFLDNYVDFFGLDSADGAGVYLYYSNARLENCFLARNLSNQVGGGICVGQRSHATLVNCTLAGNFGYGVYCYYYESSTLINSIVWDNKPDELFGNVYAEYTCIQGTWECDGIGNIHEDPCFADADNGDYHLLPSSPCIDAGDPNYIGELNEKDLDGKPRVIGGRVDMGAYEFYLLYVDDDGPNDPGPGDPQVSDLLENGTDAHPFDTIQEGINVAKDGYTVLVRQGSYFELGTSNCIDFLGKNITLTSEDPTDWDIVNNTIIRRYVQFSGTEVSSCKFTGFRISNLEGAIYGNHTHATISHCNISGNGSCGATVIKDCDGTISNCLITDNTTFSYCGVYPVVFGCNGLIKNCTIANNESGLSVGTAKIENCIIYNNFGSQLAVTNGGTLNISYSNLQNGLAGVVGEGTVNWGPGNIDTDPCFVRLGYWVIDDATLIEGDYHLKSEGWRWNTEGKSWTYDFVTSRCVDAGNPGSPLRGELMSVPRDPNNVWGVNIRINIGAYGGTSQASMPPHDWALLADLNNDGTANFVDFAYQAQDWLTIAPEQPGDLNRDGVLNTMDLAALAENWLEVTEWVNQPRAVYITQPPGGWEFCWLTESVWIEANVSDVDGSVVKVEFFVNGEKISEDNNGTDGWLYVTSFDIGTYTLTAKATDNKGATTTSPPVTITAVECQ